MNDTREQLFKDWCKVNHAHYSASDDSNDILHNRELWNAAFEAGATVQQHRDADLMKLSTSSLTLMAGEMTAGEIRTVKAVLKNRETYILKDLRMSNEVHVS